MQRAVDTQAKIHFGEYEVDVPAGRLFRRGLRVRLRNQSFTVLTTLLEHAGEVVTRRELRRRLWPEDVFVDFENNLNTAVARLRAVLHDSADHPRFIETLPKHGYRFIGKIQETVAVDPESGWMARMVVLPFRNLSGDPEQEYFSEAMTEEMITELACLAPDRLSVIARTTAMHYKDCGKDVARIGGELKVEYALEGSAQWAGERIGINLQLIQVKDQMHLLARRYDCGPEEMLATVNAASRAVAKAIGIDLGEERLRVGLKTRSESHRRPPQDVGAYKLYLQARHYYYHENPYGLAKSKELLEKAVARDPHLAVAYDALSEIYWYLGFLGYLPPKEACSIGIYYALRAVEIDNSLAQTHALLGMYRKELDFNWPEVQREMGLALALDPSSPLVRLRYAISGLMVPGRVQEAITQVQLALESDPLSAFTRSWLAVMFWLGRDYDRAIQEGKLVLELAPEGFMNHGLMGYYYREKRMFDEAIAAHRRAVELSDEFPLMLGWLGLALAQSGRTSEARSVLERLRSLSGTGYVPATSFAWIHLGLGEIDRFFEWMNRAVKQRDHNIGPIKSYPFFDEIRSDSRYLTLLQEMNLEP